jgi:poly(hydroxyalkanoate) granule-associated protein
MSTKPPKNAPGIPSLPLGMLDSQLANSVKESAQQIWLAGMGAFAKAQAEGGKVFDALVKEGIGLQRKTQAVAEEKLGEVGGRMSSMAAEVGSKAGTSWDRLENLFEERTAKALGRLGVPTAKEVADLRRQVEALTAAVTALKAGAADAAPAKKAATKKAPPTKTVAAKAPVAGKAAAKKAAPRRKAPGPDTAPAA